MRKYHHGPSLVLCIRLEERSVLSHGDRDVGEVVWEISVHLAFSWRTEGEDLRNEVCQHRTSTQELGICRDVASLGRWKPIDVLFSFRIRLARIENSVLDGRDALIGRRTGTIQLRNWQLDVYGTDLVRTGIFGEAWHGAQT